MDERQQYVVGLLDRQSGIDTIREVAHRPLGFRSPPAIDLAFVTANALELAL
ncbi:MAG TPA: hypothetical protein VE665_08190 [Hyphomicrobiaceae bacterium]|nr:hypothetical protein [Hyphomicrobiaceae bacterium]